MRAPLNKIELVDQYLRGTLTAEEQTSFINALKIDEELKQLLDIQQTLIQATKRKALKAEIKATINSIHPWKKWWKWITGAGIVAGVIIAMLVFNEHYKELPTEETDLKKELVVEQTAKKGDTTSYINPAIYSAADSIALVVKQSGQVVTNSPTDTLSNPTIQNPTDERIDFNGLKTWVNPEVQTFIVNPLKGATIEGKQGTLIIVPMNAFVDDNNQPVKEPVDFKLVEATTLEDMVLYNLGTTADGKPLETGGMLYMDFTCMGKKVNIDSKRPLYIEVPTKEVKKDMMVFKGEIESGKVNWKNPKPLKKYLVNVDFKFLDFLPQGFEAEVGKIVPYKNHKTISSTWVDSLYYSLDYNQTETEDGPPYYGAKTKGVTIGINSLTIGFPSKKKETEIPSLCGIDPLSIKTIKTAPYAKTFLATSEFENRIKELHKLENGNELLQLYVNNLSKDLYQVDSMVAQKLTGGDRSVFNSFAALKQTNIKDASIYQDQLSAYYSKKKKEYVQAEEAIRKEINAKSKAALAELSAAYKNAGGSIQSQKKYSAITTLAKLLPPVSVATGSSSSYAFEWASPGWVNIDQYLHLLEKGSEEVELIVKATEGTSEVYQWLNTINNLTPININGDKGKALFPKKNNPAADQMKNTFCFAINRKDGNYQWFDLRYNPYETKTVAIAFKPSTLNDIKSKLKEYSVDKDMQARLNEIEKESMTIIKAKKESAERARILKEMNDKMKDVYRDNEVRYRLQKVAFRCGASKITRLGPTLDLSPDTKIKEMK